MAKIREIKLHEQKQADPVKFEDLELGDVFITYTQSPSDARFWDIYIKTPKLIFENDAFFNTVALNGENTMKRFHKDALVYRVDIMEMTVKPDW